nr:MAG TPA: hypothetical protein [Caudoviricetes sp.]
MSHDPQGYIIDKRIVKGASSLRCYVSDIG